MFKLSFWQIHMNYIANRGCLLFLFDFSSCRLTQNPLARFSLRDSTPSFDSVRGTLFPKGRQFQNPPNSHSSTLVALDVV